MHLSRPNILITGASSGLGEGMARHFAAKGHHLALCARRIEQLESLKTSLCAAHPDITVVVHALDVCDHQQVFLVFERSREQLGGLDRVVVNAGMGKGASLGTGHEAANRKTAETNFLAAITQCEAAMAIFRQQGRGHLVTISSMSALRGFPGSGSVYAATKAGLRTLSEGLRADVYGTDIRVSCILPGFILTPINEDLRRAPFRVGLEEGVAAMVRAIDTEKGEAWVPAWPWRPVGWVMKWLPLRVLAKMR